METLKEFFDSKIQNLPEEFEPLLGKHFISFLHEEKLFSFQLAQLDRIIKYWMKENPNSDWKPIIDFLLCMLDSENRDASILFSEIPVTIHEDYMLDKLFSTYSTVFDPVFLSKDHFIYLYHKVKELELKNQLLMKTLTKNSK